MTRREEIYSKWRIKNKWTNYFIAKQWIHKISFKDNLQIKTQRLFWWGTFKNWWESWRNFERKKREYINVDIFYWQLLLVTQKEIPADNKYLLPKIKVHFWISEQYPLSRNCNLVLLSPSSGYKTIVCWTIFS